MCMLVSTPCNAVKVMENTRNALWSLKGIGSRAQFRDRVSLSSYLSRTFSHVSFPHSCSLSLCSCLSPLSLPYFILSVLVDLSVSHSFPLSYSFYLLSASHSFCLSLLGLTFHSLSSRLVCFTRSVHQSLGGHRFSSLSLSLTPTRTLYSSEELPLQIKALNLSAQRDGLL